MLTRFVIASAVVGFIIGIPVALVAYELKKVSLAEEGSALLAFWDEEEL